MPTFMNYFTRTFFWIVAGIVFLLISANGWEQYGATSLVTGFIGGCVVAAVLTFLRDQFAEMWRR